MLIHAFKIPKRQEMPANPFLPLVGDGHEEGLRRLERMLHDKQDDPYIKDYASDILVRIALTPEKFARPDVVAAMMFDKGQSGTELFKNLCQDTWKDNADVRVWGMCVNDMRPDAVRASAIYAAEYIRYQLGQSPTGQYDLPIQNIFDKAPQHLATPFQETALKNAVLATQNALVDHVASCRNSASLIRGGEILALLLDDTGSNALWGRKLQQIRASNIYSSSQGDVRRYKLVFEPL